MTTDGPPPGALTTTQPAETKSRTLHPILYQRKMRRRYVDERNNSRAPWHMGGGRPGPIEFFREMDWRYGRFGGTGVGLGGGP